MATVRQLLTDLTHGKTTIEAIRADFLRRTWPALPEITDAQAAGVVDTPLPPADSIEWVQIHGGLTPWQRRTLLQAYDKARQSTQH